MPTPLPQLCKGIFLYIVAEESDTAFAGIVKAGHQVDQRGLAAAGAADDADGLAGLCRKAHVGQAGGAGTAVSKGDTLEGYGRHIAAGSQFRGCGVRHGGAGVENLIDAQAAGQGAGHRDHQIGQTQKVDEDLAQIIDQGNHFALGEVAHIDFPAAEQQQCDDRQVDHQIGERIHQSGDPAGPDLHGFQMVVGFHEGGQFIGLAGKSPHHTGAHVVFAVSSVTRSRLF